MGKQLKHSLKKTQHMSTKKVNFNFPIKGLDDKPIQVDGNGEFANAGKILATRLSGVSKGDIFKLMEWARKCYRGEDIELNLKEEETFKEFVTNAEDLTVLTKEQILTVLSKNGKE